MIHNEGDQESGLCFQCGRAQFTFKVRDVPLSSGSGVVPDILAGVCNTCDQVMCIPAQSTPAIGAFIKKLKEA